MGDRDHVALMQAHDHLPITIAQVAHQAVVESAIPRPRIERDEGDIEPAEHLRGDITLSSHRRLAVVEFRPIDVVQSDIPHQRSTLHVSMRTADEAARNRASSFSPSEPLLISYML
jgi:hypothetical protein